MHVIMGFLNVEKAGDVMYCTPYRIGSPLAAAHF